MKIHYPLTPEQFTEKAGNWLSHREAENHLMLGIVSNLLRKTPEGRARHHLIAVEAAGEIVGAVVQTPPFPLVVTLMPEEILPVVADELARLFPLAPGISGPRSVSFALSREIASRLERKESLDMAMGVYQLDEVHAIPTARGRMRQAEPKDLELLLKWCRDFNQEAPLGVEFNERSFVEGHLADQRLFVWEDQEVVSMAAYGGNTPNGIRVYMVYTPDFQRRMGYASSLTAALSQKLLDSGRKFCFLYTDMANATSNHIYQQVGYRHVSDWDVYKFK